LLEITTPPAAPAAEGEGASMPGTDG
jgi:hypothetical protein